MQFRYVQAIDGGVTEVIMSEKKLVVIGATSAIAQSCVKLLVNDEYRDVALVGRNITALQAIAQDLRVLASATSLSVSCFELSDFFSPIKIERLAQKICSEKCPDMVLIAHGSSAVSNHELTSDLEKLKSSLELNAISPVIFVEAFVSRLQLVKKGHIVVIGSVAGDRGRNSNYVYGSGKSLLEKYLQGVRHRFALSKTNVCITLVKPGPTLTPMTADLQGVRPLADVETVARCIFRGMKKRKSIIYAPAKWKIIMNVIRLIPDIVFNKLNI